MATRSFESVEELEREPQRSLHRSRSGGYVDHLEEKNHWERTDQVRRMKRYHDMQRIGSPTSPYLQSPTSDLLSVPIIETSVRRNRSNSDVGERSEQFTRYNVQEVRPAPRPVYNYDLSSEPALPSQLPVRAERRSQHQKRPSITVKIHQDDPPPKSPAQTPARSPARSPNASPRSPGMQPQLHYQYATLQSKLTQISATCTPYLKVEAADPQDLTFTKIAEQAKSFSFDLRVWARTVNLNSLTKIDTRQRKVVEAASRNLDRLLRSVAELNEVCAEAKPEDLKLDEMPEVEDEISYGDEYEESSVEADPTLTPGFMIHSLLHSIEIGIGNLKRLTRSMQDASPDARDEVMQVGALVKQVTRYFGSQEAIAKYKIDEKFAGGKALDEAIGGLAAL